MTEPLTTDPYRIALSLVSAAAPEAPPQWHGWAPAGPLPVTGDERSAEAPEPWAPQGAYADAPAQALLAVPLVPEGPARSVELLAPAGGPEAAFAAFHFGADAVYLGLKKFSARAEAENFTL